MAFNFQSQTKTTKSTVVAVIALIVIALAWWAMAADRDIVEPEALDTDSSTSTLASSTKDTKGAFVESPVVLPKNAVPVGTYANGKHVGYIRNLSKVNGYTFTVDFVEYLTGKEAFLAAAAEAGVQPQYNWDIMKDRYPTYAQLLKGVRALTEVEFDALYSSYSAKAGDDKTGILSAFPNGYVYIRNKSSAVRVLPSDKQLGSASVSNGSIQISMDDLYLICHNPSPAVLDMYYRKYQAGVTCENPVQFTVSKGKVTAVQIVYQP